MTIDGFQILRIVRLDVHRVPDHEEEPEVPVLEKLFERRNIAALVEAEGLVRDLSAPVPAREVGGIVIGVTGRTDSGKKAAPSELNCPPGKRKALLNRGQEVPKQRLTSPGRIRYNESEPRDCI